ncbi:MAG TPA: ATP-binding protein [Balneolaceae bacterium]|nr:ATP-binding protein [Balneolaceae bacterium]
MKDEILRFFKHVRIGYLIFSTLLIFGVLFGAFEIIQASFFADLSNENLRWLHFSRGLVLSLFLMLWSAWTVYNYREIYQEKLETTEGYYRDIVTHSADAIITLDIDGTITSWNRGAENILGWKSDEMVGESVEKIIPQELLEMGELKCIETGLHKVGDVTNYETERLHKDGSKVLVSLTESLIRNEKGEIIGRSKILRDLTDLKMKEEQIQHSERLATLGHMAAGVAHEVGNPLTSISSLVQVCQRKTSDEFIQEQLSRVHNHIQRITNIVRDLVDFSRPSSNQKEMMQVNEIINNSVGLLKHDARCRDVDFQLDLTASLPKTEGVPDYFNQVMVNLLLNAVDAMEDVKKKDRRVIISSWEEKRNIKISIEDVGKGIKEEHMPHIFEPFFTTKEVGSGTGLGLSVTHGIINKMGGTIRANSTYGEGTTFTIKLPKKN